MHWCCSAAHLRVGPRGWSLTLTLGYSCWFVQVLLNKYTEENKTSGLHTDSRQSRISHNPLSCHRRGQLSSVSWSVWGFPGYQSVKRCLVFYSSFWQISVKYSQLYLCLSICIFIIIIYLFFIFLFVVFLCLSDDARRRCSTWHDVYLQDIYSTQVNQCMFEC